MYMGNTINPGASVSIGQPRRVVNPKLAEWFDNLVKG